MRNIYGIERPAYKYTVGRLEEYADRHGVNPYDQTILERDRSYTETCRYGKPMSPDKNSDTPFETYLARTVPLMLQRIALRNMHLDGVPDLRLRDMGVSPTDSVWMRLIGASENDTRVAKVRDILGASANPLENEESEVIAGGETVYFAHHAYMETPALTLKIMKPRPIVRLESISEITISLAYKPAEKDIE